MKTLYQKTIWAPGAVPIEEWPYRNIKRILFPFVDVAFFVGGVIGLVQGIPVIKTVFSQGLVEAFSISLMIVAFFSLIGVSFPKCWMMEMISKSLMIGWLTVFLGSLLATAIQVDGYRWFSVTITMVAMSPVIWRLSLLGSEWQIRRHPPEVM